MLRELTRSPHIGSFHGRVAAFLRGTDPWVAAHHSAGRLQSPGVDGPLISAGSAIHSGQGYSDTVTKRRRVELVFLEEQ